MQSDARQMSRHLVVLREARQSPVVVHSVSRPSWQWTSEEDLAEKFDIIELTRLLLLLGGRIGFGLLVETLRGLGATVDGFRVGRQLVCLSLRFDLCHGALLVLGCSVRVHVHHC